MKPLSSMLAEAHLFLESAGVTKEQLRAVALQLAASPQLQDLQTMQAVDEVLGESHEEFEDWLVKFLDMDTKDLDPTDKNKFQGWILKQIRLGNIPILLNNSTPSARQVRKQATRVLSLYHNLIERNTIKDPQKRNIFSFKSIEQIMDFISPLVDAENDDTLDPSKIALHKMLQQDGIQVVGTPGNYIVFRITSPGTCERMSDRAKARWCTNIYSNAERFIRDDGSIFQVWERSASGLDPVYQFSPPNFREFKTVENQEAPKESVDKILSNWFFNNPDIVQAKTFRIIQRFDMDLSSAEILELLKKDVKHVIDFLDSRPASDPLVQKALDLAIEQVAKKEWPVSTLFNIVFQVSEAVFLGAKDYVRWTDAEPYMAQSPKNFVVYMYNTWESFEDSPDYEQLYLENATLNEIVKYAVNFKEGRWPEFEAKVLSGGLPWLEQASKLERTPTESLVRASLTAWMGSGKSFSSMPVISAEEDKKILRALGLLMIYAKTCIKGRWPEIEPWLIEVAQSIPESMASYISLIDKDDKEGAQFLRTAVTTLVEKDLSEDVSLYVFLSFDLLGTNMVDPAYVTLLKFLTGVKNNAPDHKSPEDEDTTESQILVPLPKKTEWTSFSIKDLRTSLSYLLRNDIIKSISAKMFVSLVLENRVGSLLLSPKFLSYMFDGYKNVNVWGSQEFINSFRYFWDHFWAQEAGSSQKIQEFFSSQARAGVFDTEEYFDLFFQHILIACRFSSVPDDLLVWCSKSWIDQHVVSNESLLDPDEKIRRLNVLLESQMNTSFGRNEPLRMLDEYGNRIEDLGSESQDKGEVLPKFPLFEKFLRPLILRTPWSTPSFDTATEFWSGAGHYGNPLLVAATYLEATQQDFHQVFPDFKVDTLISNSKYMNPFITTVGTVLFLLENHSDVKQFLVAKIQSEVPYLENLQTFGSSLAEYWYSFIDYTEDWDELAAQIRVLSKSGYGTGILDPKVQRAWKEFLNAFFKVPPDRMAAFLSEVEQEAIREHSSDEEDMNYYEDDYEYDDDESDLFLQDQ